MKIKLIVVGKNKHQGIQSSIDEYMKQLNNVEIITVADGKNKEDMKKEGLAILDKISSDEYVIALTIKGLQLSSEDFAKRLEEISTYKTNKIVFIIGGSYGLSLEVLQRANEEMSLSKMTFPHLLARLILVEQVYRAQMILKQHPYHK